MDKVQVLIKNIPETPYGQYPEGVEPERESTTTSSGSSRLSPAEVARMNKVQAAKTLLIEDTRKAQAICDFVKTMFIRDVLHLTEYGNYVSNLIKVNELQSVVKKMSENCSVLCCHIHD